MISSKMTPAEIHKMCSRYKTIEKDQETGKIITTFPSIESVLLMNLSFQKIKTDEKTESLYVHADDIKDDCRLIIAKQRGGNNSGWLVYMNDSKFLFMTDFIEYLIYIRNGLKEKYEEYAEVKILSRDEIYRSKLLHTHIKYITKYLKTQTTDNFAIELIEQTDSDAKVRNEQVNEIEDDLHHMFPKISDEESIKISNLIENSVYNMYKDIYSGKFSNFHTDLEHFPRIENEFDDDTYKILKKFIEYKHSSDILYTDRTGDYSSYKYRISMIMYNIYKLNDYTKLKEALSNKWIPTQRIKENKVSAYDRIFFHKKLYNIFYKAGLDVDIDNIEMICYKLMKNNYNNLTKKLLIILEDSYIIKGIVKTTDVEKYLTKIFTKYYIDQCMKIKYKQIIEEINNIKRLNLGEDYVNINVANIFIKYNISSIPKEYNISFYWNSSEFKKQCMKQLTEIVSDDFLKIITKVYHEVESEVEIPEVASIKIEEIFEPLTKEQEKKADYNLMVAKRRLVKLIIEKYPTLIPEDFNRLEKLDYDADLSRLLYSSYESPNFVTHIPIDVARNGVFVYPVKKRNGFLIGGNFPHDAKFYRYRDINGKVKTKLVELCEWLDHKCETGKLPDDIFANVTDYENKIMSYINKKIEKRFIIILRNFGIIYDYENILKKLSETFDILGDTPKDILNKFNKIVFGVNSIQPLIKYRDKLKEPVKFKIDESILINTLRNNGKILCRKIHHSEKVRYPVPIGYNEHNYPMYSRAQKGLLAHLVSNGLLNPWLTNKVIITHDEYRETLKKLNKIKYEKKYEEIKMLKYKLSLYNKIVFTGSVPFIIDEYSDIYTESHNYVEQIYKDYKYGLPISVKIGIFINKNSLISVNEKRIIASQTIDIETEQLTNDFFKNKTDEQTETYEFLSLKLQHLIVTKMDILKKGSYAFLDSRNITKESKLKYEPKDDVWEWDPIKDKKARAYKDADLWYKTRSELIIKIRESLIKNGSSSSAFIQLKNLYTRQLSIFRENLPSQIIRKSSIKSPVIASSKNEVVVYNRINTSDSDFFTDDVQLFIKYGLLSIDKEVVSLLSNLHTDFVNYKVFDITYDNDGIKNYPVTEFKFYEIIYNIIKNMEYTSVHIYDPKILPYVNDIELLDSLDTDDYFDVVGKHPILKILQIINTDEHNRYENKKFSLWNILSATYNTWYSPKGDRKQKRLRYEFQTNITINIEDALNYLGDSYFQNSIYEKGHRSISVITGTKSLDYVLTPGCIFELVENTPKTNKLFTNFHVSKEITKKNDITLNIMVITGTDLHKKYGISTNDARRCALIYNVDINDVDPGFGVSDILTKGPTKRPNFALHKEDILKYKEKGGNPYTLLEMSENEVVERKRLNSPMYNKYDDKVSHWRNEQSKAYHTAVEMYYASTNKEKTLEDILSKTIKYTKIDRVCISKYIRYIDMAIEKGNVSKKKDSIKQYAAGVEFYPDIIIDSWHQRKKYIDKQFHQRYGFSVEHFIGNNRRNLYIGISQPRELFDTSKTFELPY